MTEKRKSAFERDGDVAILVQNYLYGSSTEGTGSHKITLWYAEGRFTAQSEASSLTREKMNFTGSNSCSKTVRETTTSTLVRAPFLFKGGTTKRPAKTYGVDLSEFLRKCVYRLCKREVRLLSVLSNCFQVKPLFCSKLISQSFSIAL